MLSVPAQPLATCCEDLAALGRATEAREHWTAIDDNLAMRQDSIEPKLVVILIDGRRSIETVAHSASASTHRLMRLSAPTPDLARPIASSLSQPLPASS